MFIIFLLCSSFIQLHASEVVSAEEFLGSFGRRFKGESFAYRQLSPAPTDNLVTIHLRSCTRVTRGLPTLVWLIANGSEDLVRTIRVHDPNHILMRDGTFSPPCRASESTSTVGMYREQNICLKQWPEAPWNEFAMYHLYKTIFRDHPDLPVPASETFLMNGQVFIASELMDGSTFEAMLAAKGAREVRFNLPRFQRLAILCLLSVPEDGCPRNLLVRKIRGSRDEYEFVLIDNDRTFGTPKSPEVPHPRSGVLISTRAHSALFCMHELLVHPLEPSVFSEMVAPKSGILRNIMTLLLAEHTYELALLRFANHGELAAARRRGRETILGVPLNGASIIGVSGRLNNFVREVLADQSRDTPNSLASIFTRVLLSIGSLSLAQTYRLDSLPLSTTPTPVDLRTILRRIAEIDPRGAPGASAPASAYVPLQAYYGTAEGNPAMLLHVLRWVSANCETLDDDIASIIIDVERVIKDLQETKHVDGRCGRGRGCVRASAAECERQVAAGDSGRSFAVAVCSSKGPAAVQVFASAGSGCVAVSAGRGIAVAAACGGRGGGRAIAGKARGGR